VMFCLHLLYFQGSKAQLLRGAASVERPQERV
jgi:hypothetical protein